jgi:hypothetical protein
MPQGSEEYMKSVAKTVKDLTPLGAFAVGIASGMVFLFTTFATMSYVDARYAPLERKVDWVVNKLWEMSGKRGEPPPGRKPAENLLPSSGP